MWQVRGKRDHYLASLLARLTSCQRFGPRGSSREGTLASLGSPAAGGHSRVPNVHPTGLPIA
jgi:hypothetical protein